MSQYTFDNDGVAKWYSFTLDSIGLPGTVATGEAYVSAGSYGGTFGDGSAARRRRPGRRLAKPTIVYCRHPVTAGSVVLRDLAGEMRDVPFKAMLPTIKAIKKIAADEGITMSLNGKRPAKLRAVDRQMAGKGDDVVVWRIQGVPVGPWVWQTTGTSGARHPPPQTRQEVETARPPPGQ